MTADSAAPPAPPSLIGDKTVEACIENAENWATRAALKELLEWRRGLTPPTDGFPARAAAPTKNGADVLQEMADTFRERNKVYGDNYKSVGNVMAALFPGGIALVMPDDFNRWHLFELIVVKLTRFANSGLTHIDSIHDAAVYAAMVESLALPGAKPINPVEKNEILK